MQIIYKIDLIFLLIYSFIILSIGTISAIYLHNINLILAALVIEIIYLFFSLKKPLKRYNSTRSAFPEEWKSFLLNYSPFYRGLDMAGKERFDKNIKIFLSEFSIEGIKRKELNIETKLLVAMGVATLLHGRPNWEPPIKDGILVYPGETFDRDYRINQGNYAGMATRNSPLVVTQESLKQSFSGTGDGFNVIYHELAHYFDFEDGEAQGIPARNIFQGNLHQWKSIIEKEMEKARAGDSFLGLYAGKNQAELFAVATEVFFENPHLMIEENIDLYNILQEFYNIDTAEIIPKTAESL